MSVLVNSFRIIGKKAGSSAKALSKKMGNQAKQAAFASADDVTGVLVKATHKGQVGRVVIDGDVRFFRRIKNKQLQAISLRDYEKAVAKHGKGKGADVLDKEIGKRLDIQAGELKDVLKAEAKTGKKKGRKAADKLLKAIRNQKSPETIAEKLKKFLAKRADPKTIGKNELSGMVDEFTTLQKAGSAYAQGANTSIEALQASRQLRHARKALFEALGKQEGGGRKKLYRAVADAIRQGKSEADVKTLLATATSGKAPKGKGINAEGLNKLVSDYFRSTDYAKPLSDASLAAGTLKTHMTDSFFNDLKRRFQRAFEVLFREPLR